MSENNITLTRKQTKAISALLACQTIAEGAEMAGVGERTIYRWLDLPHFSKALRAAASEAIGETIRRLAAGRVDALDTIHYLTTNAEKEADRLRAAIAWMSIDGDIQSKEEVERRLAELEQEVFHGEHR